MSRLEDATDDDNERFTIRAIVYKLEGGRWREGGEKKKGNGKGGVITPGRLIVNYSLIAIHCQNVQGNNTELREECELTMRNGGRVSMDGTEPVDGMYGIDRDNI